MRNVRSATPLVSSQGMNCSFDDTNCIMRELERMAEERRLDRLRREREKPYKVKGMEGALARTLREEMKGAEEQLQEQHYHQQ